MSQSPLPLWHAAVALAERGHRHQLRKDGRTPYASHVVRVMMIVRDVFGCDDGTVLAAAVLHDYIEDTPGDFDDIEEVAGRRVAEIVSVLTKNAAMREDEREADYHQRMAAADWRVKIIKLADVLDNFLDRGSASEAAAKRCRKRAKAAIEMSRADVEGKPGGRLAAAIVAVERVIEGGV